MSMTDDESGTAPPIDEAILEGTPSTSWHDFKNAKLRRFPRRASKIHWLEYLGHGREGVVISAKIGDNGPFAVKIFWCTQRPKPELQPGGAWYRQAEWPFEDEACTVALIEKIKHAMECARKDPKQAIIVKRGPTTREEAIHNMAAFSDESRQSPQKTTIEDSTTPPPFPPLPVCYGWLKVGRNELPRFNPPLGLDSDKQWYWAIVYELVPRKQQDIVIGQSHLDFFYAIGFALEAYKPDNWRGGRLVDLNDLCSPFSRGWRRSAVRRRTANDWFWTLDCKDSPTEAHHVITSKPQFKKT